MELLAVYRDNTTLKELYTWNFKSFYDENGNTYDKDTISFIFRKIKELLVSGQHSMKIEYSNEKIYGGLCEPDDTVVTIQSGPGKEYIQIGKAVFHTIFQIEYIENGWIKLQNEDKYIPIDSVRKYKPKEYFFECPYKCTTYLKNKDCMIELYNYGFTKKEVTKNTSEVSYEEKRI